MRQSILRGLPVITRLLLLPAFLVGCRAHTSSPQRDLPPPNVTIILNSTPTPVPTVANTPTLAEALYPYTVEGLRHHEFKSGDISLLAQTEKNDIYTGYKIAYPSDGLTITGILQIPAEGKGPFPVIVMNHGFFTRESFFSGDGTDRAAEFLNRRGYLTVASDYRTWGDSEIGPSLFYTGLAIDVVNLIRALDSLHQADTDRIGMWGHSMGGGVTMKVLMLDTPVRAAVLYSTVSADDADLIQRWGPGCIGDIATGEKLYGCNSSDVLPSDLSPQLIQAYRSAVNDSELLHAISPFYHLELVRVPVQINYGTADGQIISGTPPEWSKKLHQGLLDAGVASEIFAYQGQGHSFLADEWFAFMERTAHFFDQTVKNPQ